MAEAGRPERFVGLRIDGRPVADDQRRGDGAGVSPSTARIRFDTADRTLSSPAAATRDRGGAGGSAQSDGAPREKPTAPMPANQAFRAKSYPPGISGGVGGERRARTRIGAPGASGSAPLTVRRTRKGTPPRGAGAISAARTSSRCPRVARSSTPSTQPASSTVRSRSNRGRPRSRSPHRRSPHPQPP